MVNSLAVSLLPLLRPRYSLVKARAKNIAADDLLLVLREINDNENRVGENASVMLLLGEYL